MSNHSKIEKQKARVAKLIEDSLKSSQKAEELNEEIFEELVEEIMEDEVLLEELMEEEEDVEGNLGPLEDLARKTPISGTSPPLNGLPAELTSDQLFIKLITTLKFEVRREVLSDIMPIMQGLERAVQVSQETTQPSLDLMMKDRVKVLEDKILIKTAALQKSAAKRKR